MSLPLLNEVVAMATGWPRSAAHFFALMTAGGEWGWTSAPVYFFQRSCFLSLSFTASRKDRWNWGRLVKRTSIWCFGLIVLGAATDGGLHLYNQIPPTVARQTQYAGLRLGMTKDEVLYIKG